jgi:hypothetical protein
MSDRQIIETTAGEIQAIIRQCGLQATDPITLTIPTGAGADLLARARAECRARVIAAGFSDDDIDNLIEAARQEVQSEIG